MFGNNWQLRTMVGDAIVQCSRFLGKTVRRRSKVQEIGATKGLSWSDGDCL